MSAAGRWFITPHAVAAYRLRIDPGASYEQALAVLIRASGMARLVRRDLGGFEHWRMPQAGWRFRVAPPRGGFHLPALLTVLPAWDPPGSP